MDPEIRESILGHWFKEKSVSERYGRIGHDELVRSIDLMTVDHGGTEVFVAGRLRGIVKMGVLKAVQMPEKKKKAVLAHDLTL